MLKEIAVLKKDRSAERIAVLKEIAVLKRRKNAAGSLVAASRVFDSAFFLLFYAFTFIML